VVACALALHAGLPAWGQGSPKSASSSAVEAAKSAAETAVAAAARAASAAAAAASSASSASAADTAAAALGRATVAVRVEPPALSFGDQTLGARVSARNVTLSTDDAGTAVGTYTVQASGDFSVTPSTCRLVAGGSCALAVSFAPRAPGFAEGALTLSTGAGSPTRVATLLRGQAVGSCATLGYTPCSGKATLLILLVVLGYALAVWLVRWNFVALPTWANLQSQIDALRARMANLPPAPSGSGPTQDDIEKLLVKAESFMTGRDGLAWLLDRLFWSRGPDLAGWRLLHKANELLVARFSPEELRVGLEEAESGLRQSGDVSMVALADFIKTELSRPQIDLHDLPAAALRELDSYLGRTAGSLPQEIAAALAGTKTPPATADELRALAQRLYLTLQPPAALLHDLGTAQALPDVAPEWAQVLRHARDVLLPGATRQCAALKAALDAATPPNAADWAALLTAWGRDQQPHASALRQRLGLALSAAPLPTSERRVALLREALLKLHYENDDEYDGLVTWHRKSMWFVACSLVLVLLLAVTLGQALLFLMGALGGLLSRLSRAVNGDGLPTSYGAYWTTLLLSPLVGAMAGWGGVLLVTLGVKLGVLGEALAALSWDQPAGPVLLGSALLFGATERLFVTLVEKFEPALVGAGGVTPAVSPTSPAPVPSAAPAATTPPPKTPGGA
jgi:hypothetical protein